MPKALKLSHHERAMRKGVAALWGPDADLYEEPDWEALETLQKGHEALRETYYEEES